MAGLNVPERQRLNELIYQLETRLLETALDVERLHDELDQEEVPCRPDCDRRPHADIWAGLSHLKTRLMNFHHKIHVRDREIESLHGHLRRLAQRAPEIARDVELVLETPAWKIREDEEARRIPRIRKNEERNPAGRSGAPASARKRFKT